MSFFESLMVAIFCMSGVFAVLIILCLILKLFSLVLAPLAKKKGTAPARTPAQAEGPAFAGESPDELKLVDVDEPTAAMIMAIVSHESGIPLSELRFKSIKPARQD